MSYRAEVTFIVIKAYQGCDTSEYNTQRVLLQRVSWYSILNFEYFFFVMLEKILEYKTLFTLNKIPRVFSQESDLMLIRQTLRKKVITLVEKNKH